MKSSFLLVIAIFLSCNAISQNIILKNGFYTDSAKTRITEGERMELFNSRDLSLKILLDSTLLSYDMIYVWLNIQKIADKGKPIEWGWLVGYKKQNLNNVKKTNPFVELPLMTKKSEWGLFTMKGSNYGTPIHYKVVMGKYCGCKGEKCDSDIVLNYRIVGCMKTGTEQRWESQYTNGTGNQTLRSYDTYDNGSIIFEDNSFVIKANE